MATGLCFSAALFFFSAFLLVILYKSRWKSTPVFLGLWAMAIGFAGIVAGLINGHFLAAILAITLTVGLALIFYKIKPVISWFGAFFVASMLLPAIYTLAWLYQLMGTIGQYFNGSWLVYFMLFCVSVILSALTVLNTIMLVWVVLVRYAPLYFNFPRLSLGWQIANKATNSYPKISIHVPCFNEPPHILIATLDALARQTYPNFEVIVLDNNTKNVNIWRPIAEYCQQLGEHFRFYHIDSLPGAKAGALNVCLQRTAKDAELISVMDADYIAKPDFLAQLVGFFDDPKIGFVQSCQDYRDWQDNAYQSACYYEYETHFKLELFGQNEFDVTYTIGTLCLIRRKALEDAGGWAEWCLTEDSEVAVRMHALGYAGYYLRDSFGSGLIPETFESYKQQRFRWTAGPVQQFKKHWRLYMPWGSTGKLTSIQKFGEIFHSLAILFSEVLNLLVNVPLLGICLWLKITKGESLILPMPILYFIPIAFTRNIICNWLSIRLLGGNWKNYLLSAMAARSLIYTRNMAFFQALTASQLTWKRTDKFKASANLSRALNSSYLEVIMAALYIVFASFLVQFVNFKQPDVLFLIWLGIVNQTISFLCAPAMAFLSERQLRQSNQELVGHSAQL